MEKAMVNHGAGRRFPWRKVFAVACLAAWGSTGCTSTRESFFPRHAVDPADAADLIWPPPPAQPRIRYIGSIEKPNDMDIKVSLGARVASWFTGWAPWNAEFVKPVGLCFDDAGDVCVADPGASSVWSFERATRRYQRWSRIGDVQLVSPVAVVRQGERIFIADTVLGQIIVCDRDGKFQYVIDADIERPADLAIRDESLLVVDAKQHAILRFDLEGRFLARYGGRGTDPGAFNFPTHITTDAQGRIYVTDSLNFRVQILDAEGQPVGFLGRAGDGTGSFSRPKGIGVDSLGHIYVADALFDNVQVFSQEGRFLLHWGEAGSGPAEFWMPADIAIGPENIILVADSYNQRIQLFQYIGDPE